MTKPNVTPLEPTRDETDPLRRGETPGRMVNRVQRARLLRERTEEHNRDEDEADERRAQESQ